MLPLSALLVMVTSTVMFLGLLTSLVFIPGAWIETARMDPRINKNIVEGDIIRGVWEKKYVDENKDDPMWDDI